MATRLGRFEMPKQVTKDETASTENYGKFYAEPFEGGYGRTMGNSLRRVLLSDLPGLAIVGVHINNVSHEFSTISGLKEDVIEILLNLKQIVFKGDLNEPSVARLVFQGPGVVTAQNLEFCAVTTPGP